MVSAVPIAIPTSQLSVIQVAIEAVTTVAINRHERVLNKLRRALSMMCLPFSRFVNHRRGHRVLRVRVDQYEAATDRASRKGIRGERHRRL